MSKNLSMNVVNQHACGIDVGSRSHWVCVGQGSEDFKEFGVYSEDYHQMIDWLKQRRVLTIAMESTGSYWQTLFSALQEAGFEVLLVNGQQTKNHKGKTDIKDCQWIQKLHSLGMLNGSFLPSHQVEQLRTYQRHRAWMVEQCSKLINKMQKSLRLMNFRLDIAISDISGKSGMRIIKAILDGERDGSCLAELADGRIRKSKAEIAKALQGSWNEGLMYELKTCFDLYQDYKGKLDDCDKRTVDLLNRFIQAESDTIKSIEPSSKKAVRNQHKFNVSAYCIALVGVDLMRIEGIKEGTVMTFLSEVGKDIFKFSRPKQFTSWLRIAPNNKISGGKLLSSRTPKSKNTLAIALRQAANSIGLMKEGTLVSFFKRIAYRKGRAAAITATARKLAVIIWMMVVKKVEYKPLDETIYNEKIKKKIITNINQKMKRMNLSISDLSVV